MIEQSRQPAHDPYAHRRGEPRTFIALWVVLLFATIAVTLGSVGMLGLLATDVYRPAARRSLVIIMVACVVLWPTLRLSQTPPPRPARAFAVDSLAVLVPLQAMIWPQSLPWMAAWPCAVSACVAAWFAAWTLAVGGGLAWYFARGEPAYPRWVMMTLVVAVSVSGVLACAMRPAWDLDADPQRSADLWMMTSPITGVWELTQDRSWTGDAARVSRGHWWSVGGALVLALAAWCGWWRASDSLVSTPRTP